MIKLKKIDGTEILINADLIDFAEGKSDTIVSLTTGNKIVVRDTLDEIREKTVEYRRSIQKSKNNS